MQGKVNAAIGRDHKHRTRMAVTSLAKGREALTYYRAIKTFGRGEKTISLMECRLQTGRTHQIRVHMSHIGFSLIGDHVYGAQRTKQISLLNRGDFKAEGFQDKVLGFPRQALHAGEIKFIHPRTEEEMHFTADYPADIQDLIDGFVTSDKSK
jgi:23S rRNA pseudouridine1911/1915/1917 synthase